MTAKRIVHIVGTGTIGEPLIGLFTDFRTHLGIDEVTFHKRTPMTTERAKVNHLMSRGAQLCTDSDRVADFEKMGHKVSHEASDAIRRATVIIDCTPAGNDNKETTYANFPEPNGFVAEYTTELDQLDDATHVPQDANYWQKIMPNPDRWGLAGPPSNRMRAAMSGALYLSDQELGKEPAADERCEDIIGRKLG